MKTKLEQEKVVNTQKVTTKSLEQRLTQAQTKIEELNSIKSESEQLSKKYSILKTQFEVQIKEIEGLKKSNGDIQKMYEDLEKKAANAPVAAAGGQATHEENLGNFRRARAVNQQSR